MIYPFESTNAVTLDFNILVGFWCGGFSVCLGLIFVFGVFLCFGEFFAFLPYYDCGIIGPIYSFRKTSINPKTDFWS